MAEDSSVSVELAEDNATALSPSSPPSPYRVLARKYRPSTFREMIGQDAMVRVLSNAISSGRLAHAFMLTGVRGVGKTTTARVLARGLNCIGPDADASKDDGKDTGPTIEPCGVCVHCVAIAEDRHVDVLEMDAASRTGVDNIRELIEGVRYRPTSARYKVYIMDEVHMLSRSAFAALLKTLEEPPAHVKFIFATTDIHKVSLPFRSRCQRFDLRRVEVHVLADYFSELAAKEKVSVDPTAVHLIARAADGSVRDGLSLLDQAISNTTETISETYIREMLGLADRSQTFDLFEALMKGDATAALDIFAAQYASGTEPGQVVEDLLEVTHWLTRIKVSPSVVDDIAVPEIERLRGKALVEGLGMAAVTRSWQMLLKGLGEVRTAPSTVQAAEMVLIRLAHASTLPSPEDALKMLGDSGTVTPGTVTPAPGGGSGGQPSAVLAVPSTGPSTSQSSGQPVGGHGGGAARAALRVVADDELEDCPIPVGDALAEAATVSRPVSEPVVFRDLADVARLAGERRQGTLQAFLLYNARLVRFEPGHLEINGGEFADEVTLRRLRVFLHEETGMDWTVVNSTEPGAPSLIELQAADEKEAIASAMENPLVQAVLETFPGSSIREIEQGAADTAHTDHDDASLTGP